MLCIGALRARDAGAFARSAVLLAALSTTFGCLLPLDLGADDSSAIDVTAESTDASGDDGAGCSAGCPPGFDCAGGVCAACGAESQPCCAGTCLAGLLCQPGADPTCVTCGTSGFVCCQDDSCLSPLDQCDASLGICTLCGAPGLPPCANHLQVAGANCDGDLCAPCGAGGEPCCPGHSCETDFECSPAALCVSMAWSECGTSLAACCANMTCLPGMECGESDSTCRPCGEAGAPCCAGDTCFVTASGPSLVCAGGVCAPCGGDGGSACCDGGRCDTGSVCGALADTVCTACGGAGEPCCAGSSCSTADLVCNSGICSPCGAMLAPCCAGGSCNAGLLCAADDHCG